MLSLAKINFTPSLFDEFFNDFLDDFSFKPLTLNHFIPYIDVIENNNEYNVELMLAGFNKENINVSVEKNKLIIKGEKKENKTLEYNTKRSFFGTFERSYELPEYVDKENISASLENGVLKIIIPKTKELGVTKKMIEIK